jgi:hypothetical protein
MDNLTKFAIIATAIVFYFLFMRKEGFALAEGVLTDKTQLDPTFLYKKGTLKPQIRNTITKAINNGKSCAAEFPQEIYIPIPKVPAQCKLPDNIKDLYMDIPETAETCATGMKFLSKIVDRVKFNDLTTTTQAKNYVNSNEADCYSQLYDTVEQTKSFDCGPVDAQCGFYSPEELTQGNMETNYEVDQQDLRPGSKW